MGEKRLALVTGGTRGIGRATSIALQQAGFDVVANYARNDQIAEAFTKETGIPALKWDVSDQEACMVHARKIQEQFGKPIEVLVNNAGITRDNLTHKASNDDWNEVLQTNLSSCFYMTQAVLENMYQKGFGRIINISSINGLLGQVGQPNYSAAKAGMIGLTKTMAREGARKGVTANAIAPGYINTEMMQTIPENVMEKILAQIPVKRLGEPQEVARCVVFLANDDSGFITGETFSINGGHHMS